jgi:hypothetical protein
MLASVTIPIAKDARKLAGNHIKRQAVAALNRDSFPDHRFHRLPMPRKLCIPANQPMRHSGLFLLSPPYRYPWLMAD